MGLLDDAIREHLDLKRRRGADPAEVERAEREALGPVRRGPEDLEQLEPEVGEPAAYDEDYEEPAAYDREDEEAWDEPFADEAEPTVGAGAAEFEERPLAHEPAVTDQPALEH